MTRTLRFTAALSVVLAGVAAAAIATQSAGFDHAKHKGFFPSCADCHAGVAEAGKPLWPSTESCAACHDGTSRARVAWKPREGPRETNLAFKHDVHSFALDECRTCHVASEAEADRMNVQRAVVASCQACHEIAGTHPTALPDTACGLCHRPLSEATLSAKTLAGFPKPDSHQGAGFVLGGHGKLAAAGTPVAASCATCHVQTQCAACHVNAPEVAAIQALGRNDRAPALEVSYPLPASHERDSWGERHAAEARAKGASCSTCHTRESCRTCHSGISPRQVQQAPAAAPNRAAGVALQRTPPESHTFEFRDRHGAAAAASPKSCETCHVRESCLSCHRPDGASNGSYHQDGFLTRHPTAAWNRDANCSDCHNPAQFCQACHQQSGLVSGGARIGKKGYHDAYPGFLLGHGQAARQSLESCASCHAEQDCTTCHASRAAGGWGFSPHGPGFKAERLQKKNPSLCIACHGQASARRTP
jgi:hypothetical protein